MNSILINLGLILLFGLQHSIMARPTFKKWWTKFVPSPIERSTYALFSGAVLVILYYYWHPIPTIIWSAEAPWARILLWALFGIGWATVFASAMMIDFFDLTGLKQAWYGFKGKEVPKHEFGSPLMYSVVRHPIYLGYILGFWAIPTMTLGHLIWALGITCYLFIAIQFEEKNLIEYFGEKYLKYKKQVPMIFPFIKP